jgi:adenosylmethionine-8-amino-7-oxononanoate aminotransferase
VTEKHALTQLEHAHIWPPYTDLDAWSDGPGWPIIERAEGPYLHTIDGRRLIDGVGSWWVSNLGHGYPRVREALERQLGRAPHVAMAGLTHEPAIRLADRLVSVAPPGLSRVFYSDNGSTAVEVAIRAAFQFWQQNGRPERTRFVSMTNAYHGDTIGAVSVGGISTFHDKFRPLLFDTIHAPSPAETWYEDAFADLEATLRERADEVAAVVVEPLIQGAAGMLMYPASYLRSVRALCDELDILLIADEVFVGFGRTGTLFACEQAGITPDFLCLSKGLTAGFLPFAATMATERVFTGFRGGRARTFHYGHSYCGNPLGCVAALATLDAFEQDGVLENAALLGARIEQWLDEIRALDGVVAARRTGTVAAVQFGGQARYDAAVGWNVSRRAEALGAYLRPLGNVTYLVPALTMPLPVLDELLAITGRAIEETLAATP